MQEMTIKGLTRSFGSDWATSCTWVGVLIKLPGQEKPEVIINHKDSFAVKLAYYQATYNEDLTHKHALGVRIINWTFGDTFEEVHEGLTHFM